MREKEKEKKREGEKDQFRWKKRWRNGGARWVLTKEENKKEKIKISDRCRLFIVASFNIH